MYMRKSGSGNELWPSSGIKTEDVDEEASQSEQDAEAEGTGAT